MQLIVMQLIYIYKERHLFEVVHESVVLFPVVFILLYMAQLLIACIMSIIVYALHYNAIRSNITPMPEWIKKFFLFDMANIIGLQGLVRRETMISTFRVSGACVFNRPLAGLCSRTTFHKPWPTGQIWPVDGFQFVRETHA